MVGGCERVIVVARDGGSWVGIYEVGTRLYTDIRGERKYTNISWCGWVGGCVAEREKELGQPSVKK